VLFEDTAALVSLAIAAAGIWLAQRTGHPAWDAAASGLIGVILVAVAVVLAAENYSLLIGEAAPRRVEAAIRGVVGRDPDVRRVVNLPTVHVGPEDVAVVVRVEFDSRLCLQEVTAAIERLHAAIGAAAGEALHFQLVVIEPAPPAAGAAAA
jgi:divalent metal cation (Fe/Co/Zn/Cd) transporter